MLLALALGADYVGGVGGVLLLMLVAALLAATFASLSNGVAVLARQRETLIGAVTFVLLPLTFLSTALMQQQPRPRLDPHGVEVQPRQLGRRGRSLRRDAEDRLGLVVSRIGLLVALMLASAAFASWAFARYQRSL